MFCPPILYAPSTDEINGFALSITQKLVERIGIYFPEEVEKQKSKKTEDESDVVKFAAKMKSWRSARKSYKDPEGYIEGVLWAQKQIDEGGVFYSVFG